MDTLQLFNTTEVRKAAMFLKEPKLHMTPDLQELKKIKSQTYAKEKKNY